VTVELTLYAFLDALATIGCHTPHAIFSGGARYVPPSATDRVAAETFDELAAAGLTEGTRLKPEFEDVLHVFARPHTEYFAHVRAGDEQYHSLVAARGRSVVVAVRTGNQVHLDTSAARDLPAVLVDTLPPADVPVFDPFRVPTHQLREEPDGPEGEDLHDLFSRPEHGLGYLRVARHPDGGERVEADSVVCYLDVDLGRVGLHRDGDHITVFPGSPDGLASRVTRLRATLD
jgi:hypothetical protein